MSEHASASGGSHDRPPEPASPRGVLAAVGVAAAAILCWPDEPPIEPEDLRAVAWLDLNTAPVESFRLLPGIGPRLADRIDRHRREGGDLSSPEALLAVPGIGPVRLEAMRPWLAPRTDGPPGRERSARVAEADPPGPTR